MKKILFGLVLTTVTLMSNETINYLCPKKDIIITINNYIKGTSVNIDGLKFNAKYYGKNYYDYYVRVANIGFRAVINDNKLLLETTVDGIYNRNSIHCNKIE